MSLWYKHFTFKENKTVAYNMCSVGFSRAHLRPISVPWLATTFKLLSLLFYYFKQYSETRSEHISWQHISRFKGTGGELTCKCAQHTNKTESLHSQTSGCFRARPIRPLWAGPLLQRSQLLRCMWVDSALIKCTDLPDSFQRRRLWSASLVINSESSIISCPTEGQFVIGRWDQSSIVEDTSKFSFPTVYTRLHTHTCTQRQKCKHTLTFGSETLAEAAQAFIMYRCSWIMIDFPLLLSEPLAAFCLYFLTNK